MNNQNDKSGTDLSVTTFNTVVVEKTKLLATLEANREKHNSIYGAAVAGYWIEAQKVLDQKKLEFDEAVSTASHQFTQQKERLNYDFTHQLTGKQFHVDDKNQNKMGGFSLNSSFSYSLNFNASWPLKFPENHLEDYNRVIDLLNFSVADKVELSSSDFDAYVRNNWTWRQSFLGTNAGYTNTILACSGLAVSVGSVCTTGFIGTSIFSGGSVSSVTNQLGNYF